MAGLPVSGALTRLMLMVTLAPLTAQLRAQTLPEVLAYIDSLHARVAQLEQQLAGLQQRLQRNSANSSQPPSADSPQARAQRRRR